MRRLFGLRHPKILSLIMMWLMIVTPLWQDVIIAADAYSRLSIPYALGKITARWESENNADKFVIHIKDSHCNYGVQSNIEKILRHLVTRCDIPLIALEGACGTVDTSVYDAFPDQQAKNLVCNQFQKKGLITGAESLSIMNSDIPQFALWGIEDPALYLENIQLFKTVYTSGKTATEYIHTLTQTIDTIKQHSYPADLYEFDSMALSYQRGKTSFEQWVDIIESRITQTRFDMHDYPQTATLLKTLSIERTELDQQQAAQERMRLLSHLKNQLPETEFAELHNLDFAFNLGSVAPSEYASILSKYATEQYPHLQTFCTAASLKTMIDHDALCAELNRLEQSLQESRIAQPDVSDTTRTIWNTLYTTTQRLALYEQLLSLSLNDEQLSTYHQMAEHATIENVISDVITLAHRTGMDDHAASTIPVECPDLTRSISRAEQFYALAHRRSNTLATNLIRKMDTSHIDTAVIISGGFHSNKIEEQLKAADTSFITIEPQTADTDTSRYLSLMLDDVFDLSYAPSGINQYIPFPILHDFSWNSPRLTYLRHDLVRALFANTDTSVADIIERLPNDMATRKTFNRLLILAGHDPLTMTDMTIKTLLAQLSPEKLRNYIAAYNNQRIDEELLRSGTTTRSHENRVLFARHILSLIDLVIDLTYPEQERLSRHNALLDELLSIIDTPQTNALYNAVWEKRYKDSDTISGEDSYKQLHSFVGRISDELIQQGAIAPATSFNSKDISITHLTGLHFDTFFAHIPCAGNRIRTFLISGTQESLLSDSLYAGLQALGRMRSTYYVSRQPYQNLSTFHVVELTGSIALSDYSVPRKHAAKLAYLLGRLIAESEFIFSRLPKNTSKISVVFDEHGIPVDLNDSTAYREDIYQTTTDLPVLEHYRHINTLFREIFMRHFTTQHSLDTECFQSFITGFRESAEDIMSQAGEFLQSSQYDVLPRWFQRYRSTQIIQRSAFQWISGLSQYISEHTFAALSEYRQELAQLAAAILNKLGAQQTDLVLQEVTPEDIIITGSNLNVLFKQDHELYTFFIEVRIMKDNKPRLYVIKSLWSQNKQSVEDNFVAALTAITDTKYREYDSWFIQHNWSQYSAFQVSVKVGDMDASEFDPYSPYVLEFASLWGQAVAEAIVVGIDDRHQHNLRVAMDNDRPRTLLNIDFDSANYGADLPNYLRSL